MCESEELITLKVRQFLEEQLKNLNIHTPTIEITPAVRKGENFLGHIANIDVNGTDSEGNDVIQNLVVKTAPSSEMLCSLLPLDVAYDREIYMYKVIFAEFNKLQKEKKVLNQFTSLAKYYDSLVDDEDIAIILENKKTQGFFAMPDRKQPLNYEHTVLILREYGKFHALSFGLRLQKPELFKELAKNTQERYFRSMKEEIRIENYKTASLKAFSTLDPIKDKELYDKYSKFHDKIDDIASAITDSNLTNPYYVFTHGDCWINNFLFKYQNPKDRHSPIEVCFLDYQFSCFGSPALDLCYFIFVNTDKKLRDKYYDRFLEEYYNSFSTFLKQLGGNPDKQFSFDNFKSQMKQYGIFGLIWSILVLYVCTNDADVIPDIHTMSNQDEILQLSNNETKYAQYYNSRIRDVIADYGRLGFDYF